ncbi:hypothetical protein SCHIN_v1c10110 [Spiroplasma chinense]|uniref:Antitoxin SocA-like Panacea domain-containing protein n=1 Tax=Spiroplasma chinense TaxID=216932 RepID=A0A5B9Y527_9MOLU|nr:type II toxin-antitoxin system antitoxin SocA domain-containing protein [Spiroplasma chinense]QEH62204.1 hypothetical protein SCHIN_v1c10110 [Spiroplasma chinense]
MFFYSKENYVSFVLNLLAKVSKENNRKFTQIQIQKSIYIVYAYFLLFRSAICKMEFETWKYGPVIYDLWKEQTKFKSNSVLLEFDSNLDEQYKKYEEDYLVCEKILSFLSKLDCWDIVQICHEQTPWKKLYKPSKNIKITDKDILKFHVENGENFFCYLDFVINKV